MITSENKMEIVATHVEAMIDKMEMLEEKPVEEKKKDTRDRTADRKEYMKKYYTVHKAKINERSNKRYVPKKDKKQIEKLADIIPE